MNTEKEQTGKEGKSADWSEPTNGGINVPDDLMPLFNKVGVQIRFHTISGKNENLAIAHIVRVAEMFFQQRISDLESQIQDLEPKFTELEMECKRLKAELRRKDEGLEEAELQIEYLHKKFKPTGSGNATLSKIKQALKP